MMRRSLTFVVPIAAMLVIAQTRGGSQSPAGPVRFDEFAPTTFSVGFRVGNVRQQVAYLSSKGGVLVFGGPNAAYAGFDFTSRLGTVLEIHD